MSYFRTHTLKGVQKLTKVLAVVSYRQVGNLAYLATRLYWMGIQGFSSLLGFPHLMRFVFMQPSRSDHQKF